MEAEIMTVAALRQPRVRPGDGDGRPGVFPLQRDAAALPRAGIAGFHLDRIVGGVVGDVDGAFVAAVMQVNLQPQVRALRLQQIAVNERAGAEIRIPRAVIHLNSLQRPFARAKEHHVADHHLLGELVRLVIVRGDGGHKAEQAEEQRNPAVHTHHGSPLVARAYTSKIIILLRASAEMSCKPPRVFIPGQQQLRTAPDTREMISSFSRVTMVGGLH